MNTQHTSVTPKTSTDAIIQHLKTVRDNAIQQFLSNDESLMDFLEAHYNTLAISVVKKEFLKRDLAELQASKLDLVHYSSLIKELKEQPGNPVTDSHPLFVNELKALLLKYGF